MTTTKTKTTQPIAIDRIRTERDLQTRAETSQTIVERYREDIEAGAQMPPVTLFFDGTDYWLADGFHRVPATAAAGMKTIVADVYEGTRRDALLHAIGANAHHGAQRTNEDKRRAVQLLLADPEWSQLSTRQLAEMARVSNAYVSILRRETVNVNSGADAGAAAEPPKGDPAAPKKTDPKPDPKGGAPKPPPAPKPGPDATPPAPPPAGEDAVPDDGATLSELIDEQAAEIRKLEAEIEQQKGLIKAASADDLKAEALKWRSVADIAQRREGELMMQHKRDEDSLKLLRRTLDRIGKALGETDYMNLAPRVEALVRAAKATA